MTPEESDYEAHVGPTIEFDYESTGVFKPEPQPERDVDAMVALLGVIFELGAWAGRDPIKLFAARIVMRQTDQCPRQFSLENKISESFVFRRIRQARKVIGSPANPDQD